MEANAIQHQHEISTVEAKKVQERILKIFEPLGLEAHPFKICWYNEEVKKAFALGYHDNTLAFCIISTPFMFEKGFQAFLPQIDLNCTRDPLDQCMAIHFQKVKDEFPEYCVDIIHDFDLLPNRRPKLLVQTAGHVSGGAYYYQRKDVTTPTWNPHRKIYGVSIHAKYSGWFSFRGALVFKEIQVPDLERRYPENVVRDDKKKIQLLEQFNYSWQDWKYRDIVPSIAQYSDLQKQYFLTPPAQRGSLLSHFKEN